VFAPLIKWLVPLFKKAGPSVIKAALRTGRAAVKNPAVRRIAKTAGKEALKSGLSLAGNLVEGKPSRKTDISQARTAVADAIRSTVPDELIGRSKSIPRKRKPKGKRSKPAKKSKGGNRLATNSLI
jgi:hypothetical protein